MTHNVLSSIITQETEANKSSGWLEIASDIISLGYEYIDLSKDIGDVLSSIVGAFDQIDDALKEVSDKLDKVLQEVRRASKEIQGHLDEKFLTRGISRSKSACLILMAHMKDKGTFYANIDSVRENLLKLSSALLEIEKYTDGIGVLAFCSPGYAIWAQGHTTYMRTLNLGERVWVWDHPFHLHMIRTFKSHLENAARLSDKYEVEIKMISLPDDESQWVFGPSSKEFIRMGRRQDSGPSNPGQFFTLTDSIDAGARLLASGPKRRGTTSPQVWRYADSGGPFSADINTIRDVASIFEGRRADFERMKRHIALSENALEAVAAIQSNCEVKPSAWPTN